MLLLVLSIALITFMLFFVLNNKKDTVQNKNDKENNYHEQSSYIRQKDQYLINIQNELSKRLPDYVFVYLEYSESLCTIIHNYDYDFILRFYMFNDNELNKLIIKTELDNNDDTIIKEIEKDNNVIDNISMYMADWYNEYLTTQQNAD